VALDDVVPLHPPTRINAKMTSTSDVLLLWGLLPPCIGGNLVVGLVPGRARPSSGADWEATYVGVGRIFVDRRCTCASATAVAVADCSSYRSS
jgi:hypothetical protein